ncbi:MAG: PEP-CTERM sorting domain-containing protein [Bryobacteraceae bacterium]
MKSLAQTAVLAAASLFALAPASAAFLTLTPPNPPFAPFTGIDIGNSQIGVQIFADSTFTIDSAGIDFNPFGNVTPGPDTTGLDVFIYAIDNFGTAGLNNLGTRGALLATGSLGIVGALGPQGTPTAFYDVAVDFTFIAGNSYMVQFNTTPDGWGQGATAHNEVTFFGFNTPDPSFVVGPVTVLDGAFNADSASENFAHIRLNTAAPVPEPATALLIGLPLLAVGAIRRRRSR